MKLNLDIRTGSVSHATMREEDLIPAFMAVLEDIREQIASPGQPGISGAIGPQQ